MAQGIAGKGIDRGHVHVDVIQDRFLVESVSCRPAKSLILITRPSPRNTEEDDMLPSVLCRYGFELYCIISSLVFVMASGLHLVPEILLECARVKCGLS